MADHRWRTTSTTPWLVVGGTGTGTARKLVDDIGCPEMYAANLLDFLARRRERQVVGVMEQSNAEKRFTPVAYPRLYFKHPNVENLVTAGLGNLVGDGTNGVTHRYYRCGLPRQTAAQNGVGSGWKEKALPKC